MQDNFFQQINSQVLQSLILDANTKLCYAAPGIQQGPAEAIVQLAERIGTELIMVFLDVDESVIRMGYGEIAAVQSLQQAGISVQHISGLRNGLIVSDGEGYSYTPTALFLEKEATEGEVLNAMRLMPAQITEALARLSPASKAIVLAQARTDEEKQRIEQMSSETKPEPVEETRIASICQNLAATPPTKFDVARQVRVFQPHFQYVELHLTGAAIQRRKLNIPKSILSIGSAPELEGRLKTTFDLIDKNTSVSSKQLDAELRSIRDDLTRSLGKQHGRVIRVAAVPRLKERIEALCEKVKAHQEDVQAKLEGTLAESRTVVLNYYLPLVQKDTPDALIGLFGKPSDEDVELWLDSELASAFPTAEELVNKMQLDVSFKDVTFDTLNGGDFLSAIKQAFPEANWDRTYEEFRAAGESE